MLVQNNSRQNVSFGHIYHLNDDRFKRGARALAQKFNELDIPAMALHTSNTPCDNHRNIVVTGAEYDTLTSLKTQMAKCLEELEVTAKAREVMAKLSEQFQKTVSDMMHYDHPNSTVLDRGDDYTSKAVRGSTYILGDNVKAQEAKKELTHTFAFDDTLPKRVVIVEDGNCKGRMLAVE